MTYGPQLYTSFSERVFHTPVHRHILNQRQMPKQLSKPNLRSAWISPHRATPLLVRYARDPGRLDFRRLVSYVADHSLSTIATLSSVPVSIGLTRWLPASLRSIADGLRYLRGRTL
eukprot:scaffold19798_cov51-Attheya_sp.AAC.6